MLAPDQDNDSAFAAGFFAGSPHQESSAAKGVLPKMRGVFVSKLTLTRFRSYADATLSLPDRSPLVVLTGPNGAGKTNMLEAVSFLAPGRGMRGAALSDITARGAIAAGSGVQISGVQVAQRPWAVAARLLDTSGERRVGTGLDGSKAPSDASGSQSARRIVRIDGENHGSTTALGQDWSLLWLTPQMDRLFLEAPSGRRKFFDRMVLALIPDHGTQVNAYERAMRERNRLLADGYQASLDSWLSAIEARLATHAIAVAAARAVTLEALITALLEAPTDGVFPRADIALDGALEEAILAGSAASDLEAQFRDSLRGSRAVDAKAGRMTVGVHKTDLRVAYAAKAMPADLCSTGEQKALLIALVLAHAALIRDRTGRAPILLLDEVAAHLDASRRTALFEQLSMLEGQAWLTGTDASVFDAVSDRAARFRVTPGSIDAINP